MNVGDRVEATRDLTTGLFAHVAAGTQGTVKQVKNQVFGKEYEVEFEGGHKTLVPESSIKPV